jgi:hypothetical protein
VDTSEAERLAAELLRPLGDRHTHVRAVADRAREVGSVISNVETNLVVCAAYLHDIGYAPSLEVTGFHPLDGARWLHSRGESRLAGLVAHHSAAHCEAEVRGLAHELAEFPNELSIATDILAYCDATTGPTGEEMTLDERFEDVARRYGPDHPRTRALADARPEIEQSIERVKTLLSAAAVS